MLLQQWSLEEAKAILPVLVQLTRKEWPDCRSFSGAVQKYLPDALKLYQLNERRETARLEAERQRDMEHQALAQQQQEENRHAEVWNGLPEEQREAVRRQVVERLGGIIAPESFVRRLCLEEVGKMTR